MTQTELANAAMLCGMGVMAVLIGLCLIRAVRGPRLTDRIVAVNMICTMVVLFICLAAFYLQETFLIDIAILYALLNLVTVAILTRVVVLHKRKSRRVRSERRNQSRDTTDCGAGAFGAGTVCVLRVGAGGVPVPVCAQPHARGISGRHHGTVSGAFGAGGALRLYGDDGKARHCLDFHVDCKPGGDPSDRTDGSAAHWTAADGRDRGEAQDL